MFAGGGLLGAIGGAKLTHLASPTVLMVSFAVLMIAVAARMLLAKNSTIQPEPECHPGRCSLAGAGVGVLTGFLGVGGGFLLVPALVKFARLPLRMATGTSLAIITASSVSGFIGHLGEAPVPWLLAAVFSIIAAAGVLMGGRLVSRLPEVALRRAFALLVLATAGFVLWRR